MRMKKVLVIGFIFNFLAISIGAFLKITHNPNTNLFMLVGVLIGIVTFVTFVYKIFRNNL